MEHGVKLVRVFLVSGCLWLFGCGKPSAVSTSPSGIVPGLGVGMSRVHVDNGSGDVWTVFVDGQKVSDLPAHDIVPVDVKFGSHVFEVKQGDTSLDRVEQKVAMGHAYIFNPKGLNRYEKFQAVYMTWREALRAGDITSSPLGKIEGRNWISDDVDFDLLMEMPWSVPREWKTPVTKIKIFKLMPSKLSGEEAALILTKNIHAYNSTHDSQNLGVAISALREAGLNPERAEILFACLNGKPVTGLEGQAVEALFGYVNAEHLPRLKKMIQDKAVAAKAESEVLPNLASLFVRSYAPSDVVELYNQVNDHGRYCIVAACHGVSPEHLRMLQVELGPIAVASEDGYVGPKALELLRNKSLVQDAGFVRKIDASIARVKDEKGRRYRQVEWNTFLSDALKGAKDEDALKRLAENLSFQDPEVQARAAYSLLKSGKVEVVAAAYPSMDPKLRREVMQRVRTGMHQTDDCAMIVLGLKDESPDARLEAFKAGCEDFFMVMEETLPSLMAASRAEKDAKVGVEMKKELERSATRNMSKLKNASPLLFRAIEDGDPTRVMDAVRSLAENKEKKDAYWKEFQELYPTVQRPENRAAMMESAVFFFPGDNERIGFYMKGLLDSSPKVRERAFGQFRTMFSSLSDEQRQVVEKAVVGEKEAALRKSMMRDYKLSVLSWMRNSTVSEVSEERKEAQACEYVQDDEEKVVREAALLLSSTQSATKSAQVMSALIKAYPKASKEAKDAVLAALAWHEGADVMETLRVALNDPDAFVRRSAFDSLRWRWEQRKDAAALEMIKSAAGSEKHDSLRQSMQDYIKNSPK